MQKNNKNKLRKFQKSYEKWWCWFDWLRCKILDSNDLSNFEDWLSKLTAADYDNSNFITIYNQDHNITFVKIQWSKWTIYMWSIIFRDISIPICVLEINSKYQREFTGQLWWFLLYGSFFRLVDIGYINSNTWWIKDIIYSKISDLYISRVDYRFDFFTNQKNKKLPMPSSIFNVRANTRIFFDTNWKIKQKKAIWDVTGWRSWSKSSKRILIRAYDKLLDSEKKGKRLLYADYFEWAKVHRVEYEFLNSYTSEYRVKQLNKLKLKIYWTLWFSPKIWNEFITYDKVDLSDIQNRFKYSYTTKWYMKNCLSNWINLFGLLDDVFQQSWYSVNEIQVLLKDYLERYNMSEFYEIESQKKYYLNN